MSDQKTKPDLKKVEKYYERIELPELTSSDSVHSHLTRFIKDLDNEIEYQSDFRKFLKECPKEEKDMYDSHLPVYLLLDRYEAALEKKIKFKAFAEQAEKENKDISKVIDQYRHCLETNPAECSPSFIKMQINMRIAKFISSHWYKLTVMRDELKELKTKFNHIS